MANDAILWRRLDAPGHDACRLEEIEGGWRLDGAAVFRHGGKPASLVYQVACDSVWRTREGMVQGWMGTDRIDFRVGRTADGVWTLNDRIAPHLNGCDDLDLGFTPATNLTQLRRVALEIGQAADVPVAWLDVSTGTLDLLHQRYERRTREGYWYAAPQFDYVALLEVRGDGFVKMYPGLWEAEC